MAVSPAFLDELRARLSLEQVVGRKVMWDERKSNRAKGDLWAPCPFHHEKSASFHIVERGGYYKCFGCGASGDIFKFVQETENIGFMEAVEILAQEAGMTMPSRDPKAKEKADRRTQLHEVMEQAVRFFRMGLNTSAASDARDYLARRGLSAEALERWEIGFAPPGWQGLWDHLRGKGVAEDLILGAGLARPSTKGKAPYDTFRNRITFPIRDARGRAIAFGARAMDPGDSAKYINSPETELFDKGASLFNQGPAHEAARRGAPLLVTEGYMDVIALDGAGFHAAVAPLGTAITEAQLRMLWKIDPEPIVALDGDAAGLRAAQRLMDLALPLLEAGQSLRFVLLPDGQDPDDLIRASGRAAMQKLVDGALPMVTLLWQREIADRPVDSPERKAALDKSLRAKIAAIRDPSVRQHYGQEIKSLRAALFAPQRIGGTWRKSRAVPQALSSTRASLIAAAGDKAETQMREAIVLAACLRTPEVIPEFEWRIERMTCSDRELSVLRDRLLACADDPATLQGRISTEFGADALESLFALRHVAINPSVRAPGDAEKARLTLDEVLGRLEAERGLTSEIAEAEEVLTGTADEAVTWRLGQAVEARNNAMRSLQEDRAEYDTGANGARISRDERSAFRDLLDRIGYSKPQH